MEAKAAQDGEADQSSLRAPEAQVLGRLRLAHESDHRGGDDEISEEELPVAQVGVDLDKGEGGTEEMETCNDPPCCGGPSLYISGAGAARLVGWCPLPHPWGCPKKQRPPPVSGHPSQVALQILVRGSSPGSSSSSTSGEKSVFSFWGSRLLHVAISIPI